MSEPTGYVVTHAIDAIPLVHLDPTPDTACGGREWSEADSTITGDGILHEEIAKATALAMIDNGLALPCRRCGLKGHLMAQSPRYGVVGVG